MFRLRRVASCLLGLVLIPMSVGCATTSSELRLTVDGETSLVHYVPGGTPRPLVVVLHGLGSDGDEMSRMTGLSSFADRNGFSVVYPNAHRVLPPRAEPSPTGSPTPTASATPSGTPSPSPSETPSPSGTPSPSEEPAAPLPDPLAGLQAQRAALARFVNEVATGEPSTLRAWNAGTACCGGAATDDVSYLRRVVAAVARKVPVDRHRVYVVGLSNGGMMATRAICDAPQEFAAAGTVAGPYLGTRCGRPIWKHLHGGIDPIVPFAGGTPPGVSALGVAADWCRCRFPSSATEATRLHGYVSLTYVSTGTHSWPTVNGSWHLDGNTVLWKAVSAFRR